MIANPAKFEFTIDRVAKQVHASVGGDFTPEDAQNYLKQYTETVNQIDPGDYELVIDGRSLVVASVDELPAMENVLKLYQSTHFKSITVTTSKAVVSMQFARLGRHIGLTNTKFVVDKH